MAFRREAVIKTAEKYVAKGKIEAAIREYRKVLKHSPTDVNTLNRVGDLYARLESFDEAVRLFTQIAEQYTREGFFVKAIAIYKKIIKLDPSSLQVYEKLAALYAEQGLVTEARTQYQVLANYYQKHDNAASAITIYQRMAELEPDNPTFQLKLAELFASRRLVDRALASYERLADIFLVGGSIDEAAQVYLTALDVSADDLDFVERTVRNLQGAGNPGAAGRVLAKAMELNPEAAQISIQTEPPPTEVDEPQGAAPAASEVAEQPETWAPTGLDEVELDRTPVPDHDGGSAEPFRLELGLDELADSAAQTQLTETGGRDGLEEAVESADASVSGRQDATDPLQASGSLHLELEPASDDSDSFVFELDLEDDEIPESLVQPPADMADAPAESWTEESARTAARTAVDSDDALAAAIAEDARIAAEEPGADAVPRAEGGIPTLDSAEIAALEDFDLTSLTFDVSPEAAEADDVAAADGGDADDDAIEIEIELDADDEAAAAPSPADVEAEAGGDGIDIDWSLDPLEDAFEIDADAAEAAAAAAPHPDDQEPAEEVAAAALPSVEPAAPAEEAEPAAPAQEAKPAVPAKEDVAPAEEPARPDAEPARPVQKPKPPARPPKVTSDSEVEAMLAAATAAHKIRPRKTKRPKSQVPETHVPTEAPAPAVQAETPTTETAQPAVPPAPADADALEAAEAAVAKLARSGDDAELLDDSPSRAMRVRLAEVRREEDLLAEAQVFAKYGLREKAEERLRELWNLNPHNLAALQLKTGLLLEDGDSGAVIAEANNLASLAERAGTREPWNALRAQLIDVGYQVDGDQVVGPPGEEIKGDRISHFLEALDNTASTPIVDPTPEVVPEPEATGPVVEEEGLAGEIDDALDSFFEVSSPKTAGAGQPQQARTVDSGSAAGPATAASGSTEPFDESGMSWLDESHTSLGSAESSDSREKSPLFDEDDDFFDLAAEIERELDAEEADESTPLASPSEPSLEEIVEGFKRGVAEHLSAEDYDTHFNLGIAYREMGLLDEAIGEFQLSSKDPRYLVESSSMLGMSFLEKGLPDLALKWYRKGLEAPALDETAMLGLLYDMAVVLEQSGDSQAAHTTWVEIYGINSTYRDVAERLESSPQASSAEEIAAQQGSASNRDG